MTRRSVSRWQAVLAGGTLMLAALGTAAADDGPVPPPPQEVLEAVGHMRQMNLNADIPQLVINSVRGGTLTFEIPPIVKVAWGTDGKPVWLDDVKRGQGMQIKYVVKDGRLRAKRIMLLPKPREARKSDAPKPQGASALEFPKAPDIGAAPSMGEAMGAGEAMSTPPAMDLPAAPDTNPYE